MRTRGTSSILIRTLLLLSSSSACAHQASIDDLQNPHLGDATIGSEKVRTVPSLNRSQLSIIFESFEARTEGSGVPGVDARTTALSIPVQGDPGRTFVQLMLRGSVTAIDSFCSVRLSVNGFESGQFFGNEDEIEIESNLEVKSPGTLRIAITASCTVAGADPGATAQLQVTSLDISTQELESIDTSKAATSK